MKMTTKEVLEYYRDVLMSINAKTQEEETSKLTALNIVHRKYQDIFGEKMPKYKPNKKKKYKQQGFEDDPKTWGWFLQL